MRTHTTVTGDTLAFLASHYGITVEAIKEANPALAPLTESEDLPVGISLSIPEAPVKVASDAPWSAGRHQATF